VARGLPSTPAETCRFRTAVGPPAAPGGSGGICAVFASRAVEAFPFAVSCAAIGILTCTLGFVLAVVVTASNVHGTAAVGPLLNKAATAGWLPAHVNFDGIYTGARMNAAVKPHGLDVQVSTKPSDARGFRPVPLRWRIERNFGMHTNGYRRLTRNLEQDASAAENAVEMANFYRVLKAYGGQIDSRM
jgi:transposase